MKKDNKNLLFEEQLRMIKYRTNYVVNETPRYRPLVGVDEIFDEIPDVTNEAGEQPDGVKPEGSVPPAPTNDQPVGLGTPPPAPTDAAPAPEGMPPAGGPESGAPAPEGSPAPEAIPADTTDPMADPNAVNPMGDETQPDQGQEVDDIQNDIIKHNIAAMQSIHDQLESLNSTVQGLNAKLQTLHADVEEVREPTNTEKLMSKKDVSYPYYFNLNDMWSDNWFNKKRENENEKGVRELPDGTFIADFDDLPQQSKIDVQNSFNNFD